MKPTVVGICIILLVGQTVACPFKGSIKPHKNSNRVYDIGHYKQLADGMSWRELIAYIPDILCPLLKKVLEGIAASESPKDIIQNILEGAFGKKPSRRRRRKPKPSPGTEPAVAPESV